MAKLKTPLFMGGSSRITNIKEFQDHFDPEYVLKSFENRKLHRWLSDYGFTSELEQLNELDGLESRELLSRIASIFNIELSTQEIDDYFNEVELSETLKAEEPSNEKDKNDRGIIVLEGYFKRYQQLLDQIIQDANSPERLKDDIDKLLKDYYRFVDLDFRVFLGLIGCRAPLAMMTLMCHKEWWELCDFFDNHSTRWCQTFGGYDQAAQHRANVEPEPAPAINQQAAPQPNPQQAPNQSSSFGIGNFSFLNKFIDNVVSGNIVNEVGASVSSFINDNIVSPVSQKVYNENREAIKQQIMDVIAKCRPEWNRVVQKEKTRINMSWVPLVPKGSPCLVVNYNGLFELRAAGASTKLEGVVIREPYTLSDGLEYKCGQSCTIEYIVL